MRCELKLELLLGHRAGLERDEQVAASRVLAKDPPDGVRRETLELAEGPERREQVGRQDAAPVDQQTPVVAVLRSHRA